MPEAPDYAAIYRMIEARPEDGWDAVQKAYRRKVQLLHPDKAAGDAEREVVMRRQFEELMRGFDALRSFYQSFGALPPIEQPTPPGLRRRVHTPRSAEPPPTPTPPRRRPTYYWLLLPVVLAIGFWLGSLDSRDGGLRGRSAAPVIEGPSPVLGTLERGDRVGEVIQLLGRPDLVADNVWTYGDARVLISEGRVRGWEQGLRHRLPVGPVEWGGHLLNADQPGDAKLFGLGASKTLVTEVQGPPVHATETVWDYGVSRVYFREGQVVGWFNSPLDPLKVPSAESSR